MRKFSESIPDESQSTSSSTDGQITCTVIYASNDVKCPSLQEIEFIAFLFLWEF